MVTKYLLKIIGILIGIVLMATGIAWSANPDAYSCLLFGGGILFFVGTIKFVINKEDNK